jgi:hypothetical protein
VPRLLSRQEILALVIGGLAAPVGYWVGMLCIVVWRRASLGPGATPAELSGSLRALGLIVAVGAPIALLTALAALPFYLLIRRAGAAGRPLAHWRGWVMIAVGASLGTLVAATLGPRLGGELVSVPLPLWSGACLGALSAAVFVWIVRRT